MHYFEMKYEIKNVQKAKRTGNLPILQKRKKN